jgi:hypothetical protein
MGADLFISWTVAPYWPVVYGIVFSPDTSVHTVELPGGVPDDG